jgi:hypothetical protein
MPAHAFSGLERFGHAWFVQPHRLRHIECTGKERRPAFIRECARLLGREFEFLALGAVIDVARRRLRREPFTQIARVELGLRRQFFRRHSLAIGHCLVDAQPVAEQNERGAHRGAEIADQFSQ